MTFAQFEMKLVLATVLSRWQLELADSKPVEPVRKGVLLAPAQGVQMVVKGRCPENQRILHSSYF
jgi:unspecific monooxygenase